jgi:uncharacterized phiE125 gp8 family phage protein
MTPRSVKLLTPPTVEPVSLAEVKQHLRLMPDQTDDDLYIVAQMAAARRLIERRLGIALVATQFRSRWDAGAVVLPLVGPVLVDEDHPLALTVDGVALTSSDYELDDDSSEIELDAAATGEVVATYWAGVAPGQPIAPQLRAAILLYVAHLYANREAASLDAPAEVPMAFETLLASESTTGVW